MQWSLAARFAAAAVCCMSAVLVQPRGTVVSPDDLANVRGGVGVACRYPLPEDAICQDCIEVLVHWARCDSGPAQGYLCTDYTNPNPHYGHYCESRPTACGGLLRLFEGPDCLVEVDRELYTPEACNREWDNDTVTGTGWLPQCPL
jgi:hypothetical protein